MAKPTTALSDNPQELARQGWQHLKEGRFSLAMQASEKLLRLAPNLDAAHYLMSKTALQIGNARHLQKANCQLVLGNRDATRESVQATVTRAPRDVAVLVVAGSILNRIDDAAGARDIFLQARAVEPDDPSVLFNLATSLRFLGELDEAEQVIDQVIRDCPDNHQSVLFRADLRRQTPENNHIAELEARIRKGANDWKGEMNLHYALAKEAEDIGAHEKSFSALQNGSALRRRHLKYDVHGDVAVLAEIERHYPDGDACSPVEGCSDEAVIFIVGMPRTGTTLVERILAAHSQVESAGELHDFSSELVKEIHRVSGGKPVPRERIVEVSRGIDFTRLGHNYVAAARQATGTVTPRFIDKLPFNFLYCGLIHRALPRARIVHVVRDPMDTCYAVYKTLFGQAYPFSYDLEELATYYIAYHRLMNHWRATMPGLILDVSYENVVANSEAEARRLVEYCGLQWEPACLEFHNLKSASTTASAVQVRQPIYSSSIGKWRRYEHQLAPLQARLEEAGLV
jgi:thioredoxin-like negative regulator of GroEL